MPDTDCGRIARYCTAPLSDMLCRSIRRGRPSAHAVRVPRTVTIKRGDGGPLQIEIVRAGKQGITAELREVKPGEHYELIVALSPPQKPGKLRSWIRVKTGVKEVPETTIPVYADIPASWAEGLAAR